MTMISLHPKLMDGRIYLAKLVPAEMIRTVLVKILAADQQGNPMSNARVTVVMSGVDIDPLQGYISPEQVEVVTDEKGMAKVRLWPNGIGTQDTRYIVVIENPDTGEEMAIKAKIPNQDCFLHEVGQLVQ